MKSQIIDYIRRNRVSTTEVADCLDKTGVMPGVAPLNNGHFRVGNVFWTYAWAESNWTVHEQIVEVRDGDIVVVDAFDCGDRAILGELIAKYLLLYKQAQAIVVHGNVRDVPHLIKENWPVWCQGRNPAGCFNTRPTTLPGPDRLHQGRVLQESIAVCDDSGVVIIEKQHHTEAFLSRLEWIEEQEDVWFDCIDRRKWSTFDTVCLKKYLGPGSSSGASTGSGSSPIPSQERRSA
jgi:4-hydroxy-4-methyl-2-oxoglutarate aldolase